MLFTHYPHNISDRRLNCGDDNLLALAVKYKQQYRANEATLPVHEYDLTGSLGRLGCCHNIYDFI